MTKKVKLTLSMERLGTIIRKLREERNLPLRAVAGFLDLDQALLSKIERGLRKAKREQVVKLAAYFKIRENDLLVAWLSDRLVDEVENEKVALKALQVAEEKIAYASAKKIDRKNIEKRIKNYFSAGGLVERAWVFGSFARGEDDVKSDIDIMIEVADDAPFSLFDLADLQFQLEQLISKRIDIVMKGAVRPHIMEQIKPDLKLVYEK